jgi:arginase
MAHTTWRRSRASGSGWAGSRTSDLGVTRFAIIEAPSVLGLHPTGVERLPEALLGAGLADELGARRTARVEPPPHDALRDQATMLMNPRAIASYSTALADAVGHVIDGGEFPIVLGGDCSIVLGNLLALRRRGRYGLLFVDGHADFFQPEVEPTGEAASMDLALATGRGPDIVANIEGRRPLVRDEDVVLFGPRDAEQAEHYGSQPVPDTLCTIDLDEIRRVGVDRAAQVAVAHLDRDDLDGFWIHCDVDALDDAIMPAVDYRMAGGLSWEELTTALRTAMASRRAVGFDLTIFNPRLDSDGSIASDLVDAIVTGLTP